MVKILFQCLNKLGSDLRCEDTNCVFNSQGKCPRCEYFDDEEESNCYVPEEAADYYPPGEEDTSYEEDF